MIICIENLSQDMKKIYERLYGLILWMSERDPKIQFLSFPLSAIFHGYLHLISYRMKSNLSSLSFMIFSTIAKCMQNMCIRK